MVHRRRTRTSLRSVDSSPPELLKTPAIGSVGSRLRYEAPPISPPLFSPTDITLLSRWTTSLPRIKNVKLNRCAPHTRVRSLLARSDISRLSNLYSGRSVLYAIRRFCHLVLAGQTVQHQPHAGISIRKIMMSSNSVEESNPADLSADRRYLQFHESVLTKAKIHQMFAPFFLSDVQTGGNHFPLAKTKPTLPTPDVPALSPMTNLVRQHIHFMSRHGALHPCVVRFFTHRLSISQLHIDGEKIRGSISTSVR